MLFAGLVSAGSAKEAAPACVNPDTLPASQKGMRRSLGFELVSTDPKKHCGACSFFTGTVAGCGTCQLLSGGAVAATSVCASFSAKA